MNVLHGPLWFDDNWPCHRREQQCLAWCVHNPLLTFLPVFLKSPDVPYVLGLFNSCLLHTFCLMMAGLLIVEHDGLSPHAFPIPL